MVALFAYCYFNMAVIIGIGILELVFWKAGVGLELI